MENYNSTETFESKTHPGVQFTLRKWSYRRRRDYNSKMAPHLAKLREIQEERSVLIEEYEAAVKRANIEPCRCDGHAHEGVGKCGNAECSCRKPDFSAAKTRQIDTLIIDQVRIENDEIKPMYLLWALEAIEGIEFRGSPLTPELLVEHGPDDLSDEIAEKIEQFLFLRGEQAKNSESPTTSGAVVGGETISTVAESVSAGSST